MIAVTRGRTAPISSKGYRLAIYQEQVEWFWRWVEGAHSWASQL